MGLQPHYIAKKEMIEINEQTTTKVEYPKYYTRVYKKQSIAFDNTLEFSPIECNDNASIGDLLVSNDDTEDSAINEVIHENIRKIVKDNYPMLEMYYLQGLTQAQISKAVSQSQNSVSKKIKNELKQIKTELKLA